MRIECYWYLGIRQPVPRGSGADNGPILRGFSPTVREHAKATPQSQLSLNGHTRLGMRHIPLAWFFEYDRHEFQCAEDVNLHLYYRLCTTEFV